MGVLSFLSLFTFGVSRSHRIVTAGQARLGPRDGICSQALCGGLHCALLLQVQLRAQQVAAGIQRSVLAPPGSCEEPGSQSV